MIKFWKALQSKLEVKPTKKADQKFWVAFDQEFGGNEKNARTSYKKIRPFKLSVWLPVAASLALVTGLWWNQNQVSTHSQDFVAASEALQNEEMLSDLEFFSDFETAEALVETEVEVSQDVI